MKASEAMKASYLRANFFDELSIGINAVMLRSVDVVLVTQDAVHIRAWEGY
jgi:hypothetical protein